MVSDQKKGWFSRNWKWFLPVGCLSIIGLIVVLVASFIFLVLTFLRSSDVYQEALTKAESNAVVVRELGEPIRAGWFPSGSVVTSKDSGNANLRIPLYGSKKSGTIYTVASKSQGRWQFSILEVEIEGEGKKINLLTSSKNLLSDE